MYFFFLESVTMIDPENIQTKHVNLCCFFLLFRFIFLVYLVFDSAIWRPANKNWKEKKTRTLKSYVLHSFFLLLYSFLIRTLKLFVIAIVHCHLGGFFFWLIFFLLLCETSIEPSIFSFKIGNLKCYRTKTNPT